MATANKRDISVDFIRIMAMVFVVCVHMSLDELGANWNFYTITRTLFFTCNGIFLMLSGRLNLSKKILPTTTKEYFSFYAKKLIHIYLPFLIYSIVLYFVKIYPELKTMTVLSGIWGYFKALFGMEIAVHLWFLYELFGLFLCTPFLAKMLQSLKTNELKVIFYAGIFWQFLCVFICQNLFQVANVYFDGWIFANWIFFYVLGYLCERIFDEKQKKIIIFAGTVCIFLTYYQQYFFPNHTAGIHSTSPVYIIAIMGMYFLLEKAGQQIKGAKMSRAVQFVSGFSFSIYLMHDFFLKLIVTYLPLNINPLLKYVLRVVLVLATTFIFTMLFDTLIIKPIKKKLLKHLH